MIKRFIPLIALLVLPRIVLAADCGKTSALSNPLKFCSIADFIAGALQVLVMIALPIIVLFLVIAGFKFISAQGNEGKLGEAKKNFFYVIIGAGLIMGAWILAKLIAGTVSQLTTGL